MHICTAKLSFQNSEKYLQNDVLEIVLEILNTTTSTTCVTLIIL